MQPEKAYVPVNADNDNNSPMNNGIPRNRDFNKSPIAAEDDLVKVDVFYSPMNADGYFTIVITQGPTATRIRLWDSPTKQAQVYSGSYPETDFPKPFYIEGVEPSYSSTDFALISLTYTFTHPTTGQQESVEDVEQVLVTPLINSFAVTPAPVPNIHFFDFNSNSGLQGLIAMGPNAEAGAAFTASVRRSSMLGNLIFVNNDINDLNGSVHNLEGAFTHHPNGGVPSYKVVPKNNVTHPILDTLDPAPPNIPMPAYSVNFVYTTNDGDFQSIMAHLKKTAT
jgi:hypothetical protein